MIDHTLIRIVHDDKIKHYEKLAYAKARANEEANNPLLDRFQRRDLNFVQQALAKVKRFLNPRHAMANH